MRHIIPVMRHSVEPGPGVSISSLSYDYPPGCVVPEHAHRSDQLIYATCGVMEVTVGQSFWLIPPQFALWIPAGTRHKIRMSGAVNMRTLYLRPRTAEEMVNRCAVLHVTPLLRELIVETVRLGRLRWRVTLHAALKIVLVANLHNATRVRTQLAIPEDRRAAAVAAAAMADPVNNRSFKALCDNAGASTRTIERIFKRQAGTSFETWRRQARLMKAIELLVAGNSVKETAYRVGYRQTGAFVTMFRDTFGKTPKAWVSGLTNHAENRLHENAARAPH
jgi:AraC-like DNA-binding protein/mannose-6-phosphate isomerase-like protein (cupin superfamily)